MTKEQKRNLTPENYKYTGMLEMDTSERKEIKEEECLRRSRKLENQICNRNLIKGINIWAVPLEIFVANFLK